MARSGKPAVQFVQLQGFKYFSSIQDLLARLHEDGIDRSGNRQLHFDQYAALLLFYERIRCKGSFKTLAMTPGVLSCGRSRGENLSPKMSVKWVKSGLGLVMKVDSLEDWQNVIQGEATLLRKSPQRARCRRGQTSLLPQRRLRNRCSSPLTARSSDDGRRSGF